MVIILSPPENKMFSSVLTRSSSSDGPDGEQLRVGAGGDDQAAQRGLLLVLRRGLHRRVVHPHAATSLPRVRLHRYHARHR